jgi:hypothetical protein
LAGRKTFVSGEILTASDVNAFLMNQSVQVYDDATARGSAIPSPLEGQVTYRKDTKLVEAYNGTAFQPVGRIIQVASATKTDVFTASVTAGSATNITGLSVSITPTSTTSKILVAVDLHASCLAGGLQGNVAADLTRDGTAIGIGNADGSRGRVSSAQAVGLNYAAAIAAVSYSVLDSPSTTSAVTYQARLLNVIDSGVTQTLAVNRTGGDANNGSIPRTASTITVMEVAG